MRIKKIVPLALAGLMAFAFQGVSAQASVNAPEYTEGVIDASKKCSVTFYEYINNNGVTLTSDGLAGAVAKEGDLPEGAVPLNGVTYHYLKIADAIQLTRDNVSSLYFGNPDAGYMTFLKQKNIVPSGFTDNGKTYYTAAELEKAQEELNRAFEPQVREMAVSRGTAMPATGSGNGTENEGMTFAAGLSQGMYLFVETGYPESIGSPSSPFLLTLPMTNIGEVTIGGKNYEAGTLWQYDAQIYPKSQSISIEKKIDLETKDADGNENYGTEDDRSIGDTVHFLVTSDVPDLTDGHTHRTYVIKDQMSKGLTYADETELKLGSDFAQAVSLIRDTDYKVSPAAKTGQEITVTVTAAGLKKLDAAKGMNRLYLTYAALLNKDAVIGGTGNTNTPSLTYATDRTVDKTVEGNVVRVKTWSLQLTKTFEPKITDFASVSFSVKAGTKELEFGKEADGVYHVKDGTEQPENITKTVSPAGTSGILLIKGLDTGKYALTEESTAKGYNLLSSALTAEIKNENLSLSVANKKSLDLVHTGGSGDFEIYILGVLLVLSAAMAVILKKIMKEES